MPDVEPAPECSTPPCGRTAGSDRRVCTAAAVAGAVGGAASLAGGGWILLTVPFGPIWYLGASAVVLTVVIGWVRLLGYRPVTGADLAELRASQLHHYTSVSARTRILACGELRPSRRLLGGWLVTATLPPRLFFAVYFFTEPPGPWVRRFNLARRSSVVMRIPGKRIPSSALVLRRRLDKAVAVASPVPVRSEDQGQS